MFLRSNSATPYEWSVFSIATRVVRDSGRASSLENCLGQAGEGEDVWVGQKLPAGTIIDLDGSIDQQKPRTEVPTIAEVKAFASKQLSYTDWYVTRSMEPDGKAVPDDILEVRNRIRDKAAIVEAMDPIPPNFRDPQFWN